MALIAVPSQVVASWALFSRVFVAGVVGRSGHSDQPGDIPGPLFLGTYEPLAAACRLLLLRHGPSRPWSFGTAAQPGAKRRQQ